MKLSITPEEAPFLKVFERQGALNVEAAQLLAALMGPGNGGLKSVRDKVDALEKEGDELGRTTSKQLHTAFITPIEREDIHELSESMDSVLDCIHGTVMRMALFRATTIPSEAGPVSDLLVELCLILKDAIRCLPNDHRIFDVRSRMTDASRSFERVCRDAIGALFSEHKDDVLFVLKWREIYRIIQESADMAKRTVDVVEAIVHKHA